MSLSCDEESHFSKSIENTKAPSLADELDFEYDTASSAEKATAGISDVGTDCKADGDDIEEGEIVDDVDNPKRPCRFYQRGECAFGRFCSFLHLNDKGLYNMFDSGPTTLYLPIRREPVDYPREFGFEEVDTSWERTLQEAMHRVKQWDLVRQRKATGKVVEKVQCDSKLDVYTCEPPAQKSPPQVRKSPPPVPKSLPPVRKSSPPATREETSKNKPTASDPVKRHNFHSAWRDPWRRSPGRKILPSPPTSESSTGSRSRSSSSSPSRRGTRSARRRKNRRLTSDESSCLSDSSSDSTPPERKRSSRSETRRRESWVCKARHHRSTSSSRSWSLPRKRTSRFERHYRNRRPSTGKRRSTSSSRSSSPRVLAPKRIEKGLSSKRERIRPDAKPTSPRRNAKASPVRTLPKNLEIGRKKVNAKSVGSTRRQRGGGVTLGGKTADKWSAEETRGSSDAHWTPKKVKSENCSDMSISPLSSPVIEIFETPARPPKNHRTSPVCLSTNEEASGGVPKRVCSPKPPRLAKSDLDGGPASGGVPKRVCSPKPPPRAKSGLDGDPASDGKRGKVRKKMDPLEMELMKCNRNFASARTCEDFEKPRPTEAQNGTRAKSKKTVKKENAKLPSRKEILLKRLEAINAAIARKTKRST